MEEKSISFDCLLGGYYTYRYNDAPEWSIMRLLDIQPKHAFHFASFNEKFPSIPTEAQILSVRPFIEHSPINIRDIFNFKDLTLICAKPLENSDLEGYSYYLEGAAGMKPEEIASEIEEIKTLSTKPPAKLSIKQHGDDISFTLN